MEGGREGRGERESEREREREREREGGREMLAYTSCVEWISALCSSESYKKGRMSVSRNIEKKRLSVIKITELHW